MSHSKRKGIEITFIVIELLLFVGAIATTYLSSKGYWGPFFSISIILCVAFLGLKIAQAFPRFKEIWVHETLAGKIASSALQRGVVDYFDMLNASEQARRNAETQADIAKASSMLLCANSGASYLDQGVYRHWPAIQKRLNEGVEFRVVMLDPYSGEKQYRNDLNVSGDQFGSKMNLANLINLHNRYPNLEIQFVKFGMHTTVFAADNVLYVDPYTVGVIDDRIENRSFTLKIENCQSTDGPSLHRIYRSHLVTLLGSGESLEHWLVRCKDQLPPGLPQVKPRKLRQNHPA
ncbi:hypothetical protein PPUJ13061_57230 [Pseudomonas putida]|uniref:hypothetical protein n=1 Tax=Pseudomonas TaxID=286 RepID=UPI000E0CFB5D|nr:MULTISPECIES: hypothetical protein [Pseudomonas]MBC3422219.1 hypothetical protein [Pseudomonas sp. RW3S2]WQE55664.1 hypothetical protein U0028_08335 [Pseudomonas putida]GLO05819.1 hypothetical protein PPUJ13061_57230 [Pseudomonas putida]HDS1004842.1 hypothetical protein [Pseudomonas putida]